MTFKQVKIAEVKTGSGSEVLKATLGSCVGIAFVWLEKDLCGLAHCLLPHSPSPSTELGAKFVNQAVPSLMTMMNITAQDVRYIQVSIAGGANMMSQLEQTNKTHIGELNVAAAKAELAARGFRLRNQEVGGEEGRQMQVNCSNGEIVVRTYQRQA